MLAAFQLFFTKCQNLHVFHWNVFFWKFSFQCLASHTARQILPKRDDPFQESAKKKKVEKWLLGGIYVLKALQRRNFLVQGVW